MKQCTINYIIAYYLYDKLARVKLLVCWIGADRKDFPRGKVKHKNKKTMIFYNNIAYYKYKLK